uniref:Uncharacterized protein n=1 Tax=Arcella intermedia TaxID=1963864 RepID=A0A6B2LK37_9EUKA
MGSGGVGKSSYLIRFATDIFIEDYDPTIEDTYRKQIKVDNSLYMVDLLDTAGYEEWSGMGKWMDLGLKNSDGFIFMFSLTWERSLKDLQEERAKAMRLQERDVIPHVLIGSKVDLEGEREVPFVEAQKVADSWGCSYFEVSAKANKNVSLPIEQLVRDINRIRYPSAQPTARKQGGCILI